MTTPYAQQYLLYKLKNRLPFSKGEVKMLDDYMRQPGGFSLFGGKKTLQWVNECLGYETRELDIRDFFGKSWSDDDPYEHCHSGCSEGDIATKANEAAVIAKLKKLFEKYFKQVAVWLSADVLHGQAEIPEAAPALKKELDKILAEMMVNGASVAQEDLKIPRANYFEVAPQEAIQILENRREMILNSVRSTTQEAIRRSVQRGLEEGFTIDEIAAEIQTNVVGVSDSRAETIARTESTNATSLGREMAWRSVGVEFKKWKLAAGPCKICQALVDSLGGESKSIVPVDQPFIRAGQNAGGYTFKSDVYRPPAHPNCRCTHIAHFPKSTAKTPES